MKPFISLIHAHISLMKPLISFIDACISLMNQFIGAGQDIAYSLLKGIPADACAHH